MTDHHDIVRSCEEDFLRHGDTYLGAGWTKSEEQADRRYGVMLDLVDALGRPASLLDFGCGSARLLDHAHRSGRAEGIDYTGLDLSRTVVEHCRTKYPGHDFHVMDVLAGTEGLPGFDVIVMNGVFHYKGEMSQQAMLDYFGSLLGILWPHARRGLAFNVMSTHVDWTRDDLFHLPIETATDFIASELSRRFVVRQDYGLYEYTVHVHR